MNQTIWTRDESILVTGTVTEVHPDQKFQVALGNGHVVHGHISRKMRETLTDIAVGERVQLQISPYDLDKGRILSRQP